MGWVMMSERELNRVEVLAQIDDGRLTVANGANMLGLTRRQVFRLLKRYRTEGAAAIRHKARGKPPNNRIHNAKRDFALALIRENYADFGPTLAAEMLAEHHGFKVSRETVRKWMAEDGLWLSRKQRRTFHQPRLRRECFGELIQIDGSDHHWFEDRGPRCTLLVFIDDATSTLMELRFVTSESTFSYFEALEHYLLKHGRPVAFYSDKHTVFRVPNQAAKSGYGMTQFGRALNEMNIEILCANSSQAKGRVERANRTLQDRLVKELRLAGISDIETANAFLSGFMERYNAKFAKPPARPDNLHRPLNAEPDRLRDILCFRDERYVSRQLAFSYDRKRIILEENEVTRGLPGKYVDSYEFADGRLEFRWKGIQLPYSAFDKDQRVTHAAITENKRLSAVLEFIKAEQDKAPPKKRRAGKQRTRYQPSGRRNDGWNTLADRKAKATRAASQGSDM
ncbi:ISNCY family transposase [Leisingera daeponensis]|uniref:ISNCY family transposase n=1 Tax=Leisingera daeponensis TaxID=405746 RepID=UPI001C968716|nr:ISNCY family transposase [Leisingera daeponensis]MBY6059817.1 ISNCY family transposase [Leisingera daeponensis]